MRLACLLLALVLAPAVPERRGGTNVPEPASLVLIGLGLLGLGLVRRRYPKPKRDGSPPF